MQISGLHLHVNSEGTAGLHGTHVHDTDPDGHGHGHEDDTDLSLLELGNGFGKLMPFIVPFLFALFAIVLFTQQRWAAVNAFLHPRQHFRWRPPLRAPPIPVS